jgi:hypothetical protein
MRFATRVVLAAMVVLAAYVSFGCGDKGTEPGKSDSSSKWKYLWSKGFGDAVSQFGNAVAVDGSKNVILGGDFYGTIDLGGGPLTSAGAYDIYLAAFTPGGAHVWSKSFGDPSEQVIQGVAVDGSGNIVIAGYFNGTIDFGGGALVSAGLRDVFVAKFASDGSYLWAERFGDADYQAANALAVDSNGNIIIAGVMMGSVNFGGGTLTGAGAWDIFAAKLDPDGGHIWSGRVGDGNNQYAPAVAVDHADNVILAGYFNGTVDFGGGPLTSAGAEDIYVAKYTAGGAYLWSRSFGDASTMQEAWGVTADGSNNVVVVGYFTGDVDFGGGPLSTDGQPEIFVAKLDTDGGHLWSKQFGDAYAQYAWDVACDPADNVLIAGGFSGAVDFGGGALTSAGASDAYLAKLGPGGNYIWAKRAGDAAYQAAQALAVDVSGNAVLAGYFAGAIDFGGAALTSAGNEDAFVAKFGW